LDDLVSAAVRWAAALIYFAPSSLNHIIAGLARSSDCAYCFAEHLDVTAVGFG
jgi:hypothetical protein